MILTTTDSVTNKKIANILGIVAGTDIYLVGGLVGGGLANQESLFGRAFSTAKKHLIEKATELGADAVIGIQTSFTSPGGVNSMILVLTGTAVKLGENNEFDNDELPEL